MGKSSGESTGSRQSSSGSRRPQSHSKVEVFILKNCLNESGLRETTEPSRPSLEPAPPSLFESSNRARFRFLENERIESAEAISAVARKGKRDS